MTETPDPKNPKAGDKFLSVTDNPWTIICVDGDEAWCKDRHGNREPFLLSAVARWTPVTPTPDLWRTFVDDKPDFTYATREAAEHLVSRYGGKIARYTFAEWINSEGELTP